MTESDAERIADVGVDEIEPADPDWDIEAPEADAAEQHTEVVEGDREPDPDLDESIEVNPADVAEQRRVVEVDEDEYR